MQNNAKYLMILATLLFSGVAFADPTSDSLTQIEAETLLLKAREKQLDVQASIISKQNEIAARQNVSTRLTQPPVVGDPIVQAIEGLGKSMFATLQLSDGNIVDVQAGDTLSNGMRVLSIKSSEVVVQASDKRRIRLAAQTSRSMAFNPSYPTPALGLPLPMAGPKGATK